MFTALAWLVVAVAALALFDLAAVLHGQDSRDVMSDDHRR